MRNRGDSRFLNYPWWQRTINALRGQDVVVICHTRAGRHGKQLIARYCGLAHVHCVITLHEHGVLYLAEHAGQGIDEWWLYRVAANDYVLDWII